MRLLPGYSSFFKGTSWAVIRGFLGFAFGLLFSHGVWAACSAQYKGLATINEVHQLSQGNENDRLVEVKILSSLITRDDYDDWTVQVCRPVLDKDGNVVENLCTGEIQLSSFNDLTYPWLVADDSLITSEDYISFSQMDIILKAANGQTIDYLQVGEYDYQQDATCTPAYDWQAPASNTKTLARMPDGTGDWGFSSGNSGDITEGTTNDGGEDGPAVSIDNVTVAQGQPAVFTVSLVTPAVTDLLVDFETRSDTAIAGIDFTGTTGTLTIPAGESSGTITVPTLVSGKTVETRFNVNLSNARDSTGSPYGQISSQLGVGTILPAPPLGGFDVDVPEVASVCGTALVTVRVVNSAGDTLSAYDGTISLRTSSGRGNWSLGSGSGNLTPSADTDNDGFASYQFAPGDEGVVEFRLANASADELSVNVSDSSGSPFVVSSPIQFLENAFVIGITDSAGADFVAQRDHNLQVQAVRQDSDGGECGVIPDYEGSVALKAWLSRSADDPAGEAPVALGVTSPDLPDSQPGTPNLTLSFSNGSAPLSWRTTDVGQYRLNLVDDNSGFVVDVNGQPIPVVGVSDLWTVRPDRFDVSVAGNPAAADADGPVFETSGSPFEVTVTALGAAGNPTISYGQEGLPQGAIITHTLEAPSGGSDGALSGTLSIPGGSFEGGMASVADLAWSEVGIIKLQAENPGYLGVAPAVNGESVNVGRFIPAYFGLAVDAGQLGAACNAGAPYSYTGQSMGWSLIPGLFITPYNSQDIETRNYTLGGFRKLVATDVVRLVPVSDETARTTSGAPYPVSSSLEPGSLGNAAAGSGEMIYQFSSDDRVTYEKSLATRVMPFEPDLRIGLESVADSDGVTASTLPDIRPDAPFQIRYGRLQMENVYGPETVDELFMPFSAEYWTGSGFVTNTGDSCTPWNTSNITDPETYHSLVADSATLAGGVGGPLVLEPNGDRGTDTLTWSVPVWLEGDWNQDGALEDPSATATFGVFRGNDRIVYWRER
ncbi:hypothetical protein MD273_16740 [Marinobacter pelagius]|uniref:DUF6701 domain-containing protein n=1 Tax=Marinobacter sp. C7 TaxID=2951363 RepID=UPI001EF13636|nr:DUF6701 domain-containing protein [Marinobacter sp. C7]MCG7201386.1 hypothetical protein [Marinobacter sp. C7]